MKKQTELILNGVTWSVSMEGQPESATLRASTEEGDGETSFSFEGGSGTVRVQVDGRQVDAYALVDGADIWVTSEGRTWKLVRARAAAVESGGGGGDNVAAAPMTGTILRVEVSEGDAVAADDLLVVMEAMKMEYRVEAPLAGAVKAIKCAVGDVVNIGDPLVELDPE